MILLHWTHKDNLKSIAKLGLDPSYSTGDMCAVWACTEDRRDWALQHIAERHTWSYDDMVLLMFAGPAGHWYRTRFPGVHYSPYVVHPSGLKLLCPDGRYVGLLTALNRARHS